MCVSIKHSKASINPTYPDFTLVSSGNFFESGRVDDLEVNSEARFTNGDLSLTGEKRIMGDTANSNGND